MAIFQGLFFLVFGGGLLGVAFQSISIGLLPCGPNGFKGRLEFHRENQPAAFWGMFMVYLLAGLALILFALGLLLGITKPLPLR